MSWTVFDLEISDDIAHIKFNRPEKLNSFTPALWHELPKVVREIDDEAKARVIVISSSGKHFTAGMDLAVFASFEKNDTGDPARENAGFRQLVKSLQETFSAIANCRLPVIAAIQGGCIGAGLDLVTACDLRYASADAFFSLHEINIGMVADVGTFPRLQNLIPHGIASEMALTGDPLSVERAEKIGLVNGVFETSETLLDGAMAVARKIAAKSPLAIAGTKSILNYGIDHSTVDTLDRIATWQAGMFSTGDINAALQAQQTKLPVTFKNLPVKRVLK